MNIPIFQRKFDMHVHSKYSQDINSREELQKIVLRAKKEGLAGIAITDHNNAKAFKEIEALKKQEKEMLIIKGEEVMVKENGEICGELLCYFLQEEIKPAGFQEIIDVARKQDALVSIAHPFDTARISFQQIEKRFPKVDAIEVFNSRTSTETANKKAEEFSAVKGIPWTAGSDAHSLLEIGRAGIISDASSEENLRKAILKKLVTVFGKRASAVAKLDLKAKALLRRLGAKK